MGKDMVFKVEISQQSQQRPENPLSIAILIAFVFILRFSRTQPAKRGIWLTLLGFILSINIGLWGLFEMGGGISSLLFNLIR